MQWKRNVGEKGRVEETERRDLRTKQVNAQKSSALQLGSFQGLVSVAYVVTACGITELQGGYNSEHHNPDTTRV
jgi:hypothetical protein